jgi:hypothetical protein
MSIKSEVITGLILNDEFGGQPVDGFAIVIHDDAEFAGRYEFTHEHSQQSAHDAIFAGDVRPVGEN